MIVVDSSALIAILEQEAEAAAFLTLIEGAPRRFVSAVSVYESGLVLAARRGSTTADLLGFLDALGIEIVPFAEAHVALALDAYRRFGKGIDPKARLNLGDCATYALAKALNLPLLFKGNDFIHTDIPPAR